MARRPRTPSLRRATATAKSATRSATRLGELALAAGDVVDARVRQLAAAGADPVKLAHPEFQMMASEKVVALAAATSALGESVPAVLETMQRWLTAHGQIALATGARLATTTSPAAWWHLWQDQATASFNASSRATEELMATTVRAFGAALSPVHRKATSNARRLAGG
ncbi:MAG: hypothetical protein U1E14_01735 [Geminicoccaceae bacterium]